METKIIKGLGLLTIFVILTGLIGEYVISREVNGYIQIAAIGIWLYVTMRVGKILIKLIKV
jgi:hypothetical protein